MPFYKITVWLKDSSPVTGVRELNELSIERAWQLFEGKAKEAYKERFAGFKKGNPAECFEEINHLPFQVFSIGEK
jgi:hypothetical protein